MYYQVYSWNQTDIISNQPRILIYQMRRCGSPKKIYLLPFWVTSMWATKLSFSFSIITICTIIEFDDANSQLVPLQKFNPIQASTTLSNQKTLTLVLPWFHSLNQLFLDWPKCSWDQKSMHSLNQTHSKTNKTQDWALCPVPCSPCPAILAIQVPKRQDTNIISTNGKS